MHKWTKYLILYYVSFVVLFLVVDQQNLVQHENAHQQNAIYHGCIEPNISYSWQGGQFVCNKYRNGVTLEENREELYFDTMNEVIGYNVKTIYIAILICAMMLSLPINFMFHHYMVKDDNNEL